MRVAPGVGTGQVDVSYVTDEGYPATETRASLGRTLHSAGYALLDHDFLDPDHRFERPPEWWSYEDGTTSSERCVWQVVEDWQNAAGDVVRLALRYRQPCEAGPVRRGEPTSRSLRIVAGLLPAATARAGREAARSVRPPQ